MNKTLIITISFITSIIAMSNSPQCFAGTPPNVVMQGPVFMKEPRLVFLQAYNVYLAEEQQQDVFKFKENWYWRSGQQWHVANRYNGPWLIMKTPLPFIAPTPEITKRYKKVPMPNRK